MTQAPAAAPDTLARAAAALRRGDAGTARILIEGWAEAPPQGLWLLASACRRLDDAAGETAALQRILTDSPRDIPALLAMADLSARRGDRRAELAFCRAALAQAAAVRPPAQLDPLLKRAQATVENAQRDFTAHIDATLADLGTAGHDKASPALRHAIALLKGESDIYLQQPSMFYYPGLPQRAFYEREAFDWVGAIEAQAEALRDELLAVLAAGDVFTPYVARTDTRPHANNPLLDNPDWGAGYLWRDGELVAAMAERAPATIAALALAPQPVIAHRSPSALWSRLKPGTHIAPHHGMLNTRLICHLPLVAPDGCALRVGHETRPWRFGEMLIFDDSVEHEAWNRGASDRTVLLFEIWRPEIGAEDRSLLAGLFAAIDMVDQGAAA